MHALVKTAPQPGLSFIECPDPHPAPYEAIIRVQATSLCGTDVHIYNWDEWAVTRIHPPRVDASQTGCAGAMYTSGPPSAYG